VNPISARSLAFLACVLVPTPPGAAQRAGPAFHRLDGPIGRVHYDLVTGRITKLVPPGAPDRTPARTGRQRTVVHGFRNTITTGYFTSGVLGAEFVDWASKRSRARLTTKVVFGYATSKSGSASLDLSFYEGTTGFCVLGSEIDRLTFTGLPGRTASLPPGTGMGYLVTASVSPAIAIPDGRLGWGYCMLDSDGSGGSLTGPLLTDFSTNTGWNDAFDWWAKCPASSGSCVGTFFTDCNSPVPPPPIGLPCASTVLGLVEFRPDTPAACTVYAGSGVNRQLLSDVSGGPRIGEEWTTQVDLAAAPPASASVLATALLGTLAPGIPLSGPFAGTELLIDPRLAGPLEVSSSGTHVLAIPPLPGLDGLSLAAQAARLVGAHDFPLTNALDCTIGG